MYEFFFEFRNKSITALAKQQNKTLMKSAERMMRMKVSQCTMAELILLFRQLRKGAQLSDTNISLLPEEVIL
jgi:hypothetical protein